MTSDDDQSAPFAGFRVLDLAAPVSLFCGRILAAYGAEVIRVEPPADALVASNGEPATDLPTHALLIDGWYAAGVRRVALDIADPAAIGTLTRLAAEADVIIASPTAATPVAGFERDPPRLAWAPATAVVCLLTPFGATGPLRDWRATPLTAHAMSGLMYPVGPVEGPPLAMPGRQHWDEAGVRAAICIAAALREREAVGGQVLDIAAHEVAAGQDDVLHRYDVAGLVLRRSANFAVPPSGAWDVADGRVDIAANTPGHWDAFVATMGAPSDLSNEMWRDRETRIHLHDVLTEQIEPHIRPWRTAELVAVGQENGLPCAALNTPEEFVADQRADPRRPLGRLTISGVGAIDAPGPPIAAPAWFHARQLVAAAPGEHTASVLGTEAPWTTSRPTGRSSRRDEEIRVLTFGAFVAGNTVGMILAELGMDVVKIESHIRPEALRNRYFLDHPDVREPSGVSTTALYGGLARSVRSAAVEISRPVGAATFRRLAAEADVVIENFRPHVLEQFGCGFADLQAVNPRLTMLSISGYGRTGPRAGYAAYAPNISNHVGLTAAWGHSHGYHFDYVAGFQGALGVMAALAATERTGRGMRLDLAQVEAGAVSMAPLLLDHLATGAPYVRRDNWTPEALLSAVVACAGKDRWLAVDVLDAHQLQRLAMAVGCDTGASDSDERHVDAVRDALAQWAATRSAHQAALLLQHAGIAAAPVQDADDLWRDPQLRSRDYLVELHHRDLGTIAYPEGVERAVRPGGGIKGPVPRLGEHTAEVLAEWAGVDASELSGLAADGAVWLPEQLRSATVG